MAANRGLTFGVALLLVPWLVILVDALALGFNFVLSLAMLLVFALGLMFLAAGSPN
jgi:hypothetical protein